MQSKLTAPDGSSFNLQDYRGKIILVNFWATWCAPCRDEMPGLVKIQDEFKDKNFVIIGVNADQEEADVIKNFGEKMNLNYKLVTADDEFLHGLLDISQAGAIPQ
ncbi:MAG: TlpA disulfide reductase family protein, partial [Pyrinomonadaceae bacterium]